MSDQQHAFLVIVVLPTLALMALIVLADALTRTKVAAQEGVSPELVECIETCVEVSGG